MLLKSLFDSGALQQMYSSSLLTRNCHYIYLFQYFMYNSQNAVLLERACELLDLGITLEIYADLQSRSPTQWSLHLKSLSLGAALTALHVWMTDLSKALEKRKELPSLINTRHGKHKYSDKGLAGVFESHLKELNAPFHEAPDQVGWFLTTKVAAQSWLASRHSQEVAKSDMLPMSGLYFPEVAIIDLRLYSSYHREIFCTCSLLLGEGRINT